MAPRKAQQVWMPSSKRRKRGFEKTGSLVNDGVRQASESRGFAVARLLTHWAEIVGEDVAAKARPVSVTYGRGLGATLYVLTKGAHAPMLQMQEPQLRDKVNACYGYAAISKIKFTQTAPTGFADGQVDFDHAPKSTERTPAPAARAAAANAADVVSDPGLKAALANLGAYIISESKPS